MLPGRRIGGYDVVREIGRGGMGVVYLGRQLGLDRPVAIKVMRADAADPVAMKRFLREAELMARLRHPGIVGVLDLGEEHGMTYLVMDYIAGKPLNEIAGIGRRLLRRPRAASIVRDLAAALDHAHEHGVVHRDIKPGNVLVTREGAALLTDFGLAADERRQSHLTMAGFTVGTPLYMSPEQATAQGPIDAQSDLYSLGVIFFELLTGTNPMLSDDISAVMKRAARGALPAPSKLDGTIDRDLDRICLRATARDRRHRYPSAGELAGDLEGWLASNARGGVSGTWYVDEDDPAEAARAASAQRRRSSRRGRVPTEPMRGVLTQQAVRALGTPAGLIASTAVLCVTAGVLAFVSFGASGARLRELEREAAREAESLRRSAGDPDELSAAPAPPPDRDAAPGLEPPPRPTPSSPADLERARALVARASEALRAPERFAEAGEHARAAVSIAPELAEARVALARATTRLRDRDAALVHWEAAFERRPEAVLDWVNTELDRRDPAVTECLRRWLERAARSDDRRAARLAAAHLARLRGTDEGAEEALGIATGLVVEQPDDPRALRERALLRWRLGRWVEAIEDADQLVRRWEGDAFHHYLRGAFHRYRRHWRQAEADLQRAIALAPDLAIAQVELGHVVGANDRCEESDRWFREAARHAPDAGRPLSGRARMLVGMTYWFAYREDPPAREALVAEARTLCERAKRLEPELAEAHAVTAFVALQNDDVDEALASSQRAIELDPRDIDGYQFRVAALLDARRFDEVDAVLECWRPNTPDLAHWHLNRASSFLRRRIGNAHEEYMAARRINPDDKILTLSHVAVLSHFVVGNSSGAAEVMVPAVIEARRDDPRLFSEFCRERGVPEEDALLDLAQKAPARLRAIQAQGPALERAGRQAQAGDAVGAEASFLEAAALAETPMPHCALLLDIYLQEPRAAKLGRSTDELSRAGLEHARRAVACARESGFYEWLGVALALRAVFEQRTGDPAAAAASAREARAWVGGLLDRRDLAERARDLLRQVEMR